MVKQEMYLQKSVYASIKYAEVGTSFQQKDGKGMCTYTKFNFSSCSKALGQCSPETTGGKELCFYFPTSPTMPSNCGDLFLCKVISGVYKCD